HWMVASYAAVYVGVARAAVDAAIEHVNERKLAHLPAIRARIGRADAAVAAGTSAMRRGHPLERLYRDARAGSLQPATSDVCADWLGVDALRGDPDSEGSA